MPANRPIFETCTPRADVAAGTTKDEQFAADLAQVIKGTAPDVYRVPTVFFRNSYPTRGMKELLKAVCQRLSGEGGEIGSLFRLDTQYGGGKTHGLIALVHAVNGMKGVKNVAEFVDPSLLPKGKVRVAALDGENSDPADGLTLEDGLRAYSLWGDLAYQLAGPEGYRRVENSDKKHVAPGAETIRELFGGEPTLIMIDEVSVYLRKVERAQPGAGDQFTAFLQALMKAVESSPRVALVFTLAVGKDLTATDAYKEEHERALRILAEAETIAARKATLLNPTEEDETADVLRRRLFESVDPAAADETVAAYAETWGKNQGSLPPGTITPELKNQFRRGYPLHPETLAVLTEKMASLSNFHRIRGMVRLLSRVVHVLWRDKPADAFAIHPHHIDPGYGPIRDEITTRLCQSEYTPALKSDVAAVPGDDPSVAQKLDQQFYPGQLPITAYIARTVFLNTLAHGDAAKGLSAEHLRYSVCSPAVEPSFIEQARQRFVSESLYLDDRPGAPMRLLVEANLEQVIRRQMVEVDTNDVRNLLNERVRVVFGKAGGKFSLVPFPAGPYEVPDEVGDGRPFLVVMGYEALAITADPQGLPAEIAEIFKHKGTSNDLRQYRNNLVFVVADERHRQNMKDRVRRHLALEQIRKPDRLRQLVDHQQRKVNEEFAAAPFVVAQAILHAYRHLFYPSSSPMPFSAEPIAHVVMELPKGDKPGEGEGQIVVARVLRDQKKLLGDGDPPDAPAYVRDQTPMKTKGEISTQELRNEFRRAPKLSILLTDSPLILCIRQGINSGVFIYREGDQLWGKDDPEPVIRVNENAFVHTMDDARKKKLWPRPDPLTVKLTAFPTSIKPGSATTLTVAVEGGLGPYTYSSPDPKLCLANTVQTTLSATVRPEEAASYQIEVTDSRRQKQSASVHVIVDDGAVGPGGSGPGPIGPVDRLVKPPPEALSAEGPLAQALTELWEKARKAKHKSLAKLVIRFYEASATWQIHQALATMTKEAQVSCHFEASLAADGVENFTLSFTGRYDKAHNIKNILDPQLRSATEHNFEAAYTLSFTPGLSLEGDKAEAFAKSLTKYGSGEAFVEAHAAAQGVSV